VSNLVENNVSGNNSFSDALEVKAGGLPVFIVTEGTWKGILTTQVLVNSSWVEIPELIHIDNFSSVAPVLPIESKVRVGFKDGDWGSGTVTIRITQ
jgi:hypothetical protein